MKTVNIEIAHPYGVYEEVTTQEEAVCEVLDLMLYYYKQLKNAYDCRDQGEMEDSMSDLLTDLNDLHKNICL